MGKSSRKKHPPSRYITRHQGQTAMSAALIDLVEPLRDDAMSLEEYQMLIMIGALAWNVARYPKEERKEHLQEFFNNISGGIKLTFDEIVALGSGDEVKEAPRRDMNFVETIKALIHRKEQLFPDDHRFVAECNVSWKNENFHVTATSGLSKESSSIRTEA